MGHLYIQTAFLGDLLLSIPTLKQIRILDPKASLSVICRKGYGSLLKDLGVCDQVFEVDKQSKKNIHQQFKDHEFATIFCPHQSVTSHQIVSRIKAQQKIGYKLFFNRWTFTDRVKRRLDWPEAIRQLQLLKPFHDSVVIKLEAFAERDQEVPHWAQMALPQLSWSLESLKSLAGKKNQGFNPAQSYICFAPGSVWPTKRWWPEKFVRLATGLARKDMQILILGAPDERELCEKIHNQVPNSFNLAGQLSITESLMFLSKASGLVCNDSGAMHMASLFHLPTLAFFGPTVSELGYKPWNPNGTIISQEALLCRPCGQHGAKFCPIGTHQCMGGIDDKKVLQQAISIFL